MRQQAILNCSFGGYANPPFEEEIPALSDLAILKGLIYTRKKKAIIVTSAGNGSRGNSGTNNDMRIHYPSGFANIDLNDLANKLAARDFRPADFGLDNANLYDDDNEPFDTLDNIITVAATAENGQLAYFSNFGPTTVHLAAHVTGCLGIMKRIFPNDSHQDLIARLITTTDTLPSQGPEQLLMGGRLNLDKALNNEITP